ncbi:MAG: hypothetical protein RL641_14 [Candidatus Parcubacteria bacterium]|jgi:hypothetical protein
MRKKLKHTFIPNKENNYKPALFEYGVVSAVIVAGIILFMSSLSVNRYLVRTDQGAAVYASVLVDLSNKARSVNNQSDLTISSVLTKAAQMKADDMANRQYFSHTSPDGTTPWYWFQKAGYDFVYAGENLAVDFTESADIENAWLASPKHKENIIDPRFREIGIATKTATWQGRETTFVVQLFGTPATVASVVEQAPVVVGNTPVRSSITPLPSAVVPISPLLTASLPATSLSQGNSAVLGADAIKTASAAEGEQVSVLSETPATIIAENQAVQSIDLGEEVSAPKATFFEKALVRIPKISSSAIMVLAGMFFLGLLLFIFIEIKRQHPKHIFLGVFALVALASLAYVSQSFVLPI